MSKTDQLLAAFEMVVHEPWVSTLSGQERTWFLVYDPAEQRKVDLRLGEFELATRKAQKNWITVSLKNCFPSWMSALDYREAYFADPKVLIDPLVMEFKQYAVDYIVRQIQEQNADENTLIAVKDISSLFGFARVSDILNGCARDFRGRMLIFFPGEHDKNQFRLLDARDGWSYLARPIVA